MIDPLARCASPDDQTDGGQPPHPALNYVVTVPLDLDIAFTEPLVLTRTTRYSRTLRDGDDDVRTHIGGVVRGGQGRPLRGVRVTIEGRATDGSVTDEDGRFALPGVPTGEVTLLVSGPDGAQTTATMHVPADCYDIDLA